MLASKKKLLEPVQPMKKIRHRCVKGPQAHTVGVIEKLYRPSLALKEAFRIRHHEEIAREGEKDAEELQLTRERLKWENNTYEKLLHNYVKNEVNKQLKVEACNLEERQNLLRQLLSQEEEEYFRLIEESEETPLQRQEAMKQKAKFLKEKREEERLKFVQDKLDQQFRLQCGPFREAQSQQMLREICSQRQEQIRMREEADRDQLAVDDMYANLWREDSQTKMELEKQRDKARRQGQMDLAAELRKQMLNLDENKLKEDQLDREKLKLLLEQAELQKLEEKREFEEKKKKQKETKNELDKIVRYRLKKKAEQEQEELAFDLKVIDELLKDTESIKERKHQRKLELMDETHEYLAHLRKLQAEEKWKEKEIQRIILENVEEGWQRRLDKWRREKEARKKLINDVIRIRGRQLMEKLVENNRKRQANEEEKYELLFKIENFKRDQAEEIARRRDKILQYRYDLEGQIDFNNRQAQKQREVEAEEQRKQKQTEEELQKKINEVLTTPLESETIPVHPVRRAYKK